ncbi:zinc-binding alcohol dehydrogenase family protein [Sphingobium sp. CCH11-B1]|jgi:2-desacetyl-2-hydroxyethyl bacteriochlorophyllide A dehydrogenase|uniref:zinc-binding alcohol dehydrogenase family protein n=1 Tax=Sphingobium sp. CCH11-B1 TaxID=1768781 RepID=UPI00082B7738|nr:zinc-binding alcohol dehydrogenase family protein [Sphingobium sp. CCH11-B1]
MKAIVCREPFSIEMEERPEPAVQAGQILVRIRRVGLCGTDYHIFAGRHPFLAYPRVMGHELGGEVVEAGQGSAFRPGQTVAINPYLSCGHCVACRRGKPNACMNISVLGVHADGGMTELIAVPERAVIDATGLSIDQAAMLEFLAIGAHAVARSRVGGDDRTLVVGAGPIGVAAGLFARLNGASVTLVDTRPSRLAYARDRLGFTDIVEAGPDLASDLAARTDGEMFDMVFDATGSLQAMAQSLNHVAHGGALVLVGVAPGDLVFPDPEFHKRETTLIASRNALSSDFDRVKQAMLDGSIPTDALHTHSLSAEEMPTRIPELIAQADHVLKAIARF